MDDKTTRLREVEGKIREYLFKIFNSPIVLDDNLIHYMESTWGIIDNESLSCALADEGFREDFLDVVFHPSPEEKFFIHALLGNDSLEMDKISYISQNIREQISSLSFIFLKEEVSLPLQKKRILSFLEEMRLDLPPIPSKVYSSVLFLSPTRRGEIIYLLKSAMLEWDENLQSFFRMFFYQFNREEVVEYLRLLFNIWDKRGGPSHICSLLIKRRSHLEDKMLQLDLTSEKVLSRGLEYVLTSRIPMCAVPREKREQEFYRINELLSCLFPHVHNLEDMF